MSRSTSASHPTEMKHALETHLASVAQVLLPRVWASLRTMAAVRMLSPVPRAHSRVSAATMSWVLRGAICVSGTIMVYQVGEELKSES